MNHAPGYRSIVEDARSRIQEMTSSEYRRRVDAGERFELVDVREDFEWARGRLPGARHIGKGVLERDVEREIPEKETPIVLYCGGGSRSALAAGALQRLGYRNVWSLAGGIRGWKEMGLPVEPPA